MFERAFRKIRRKILFGFLDRLTGFCVKLLQEPLNQDDEESKRELEQELEREFNREHIQRRPVPRIILHFAERYLQWESEQKRQEERQEKQARENAFEPWMENPFELIAERWRIQKREREAERRERDREYQDLINRVRELITGYQEKREKLNAEADNKNKNNKKNKNKNFNQEDDMAKTEYLWEDRKHFLWFPWSFTIYRLSRERLFCQTGFLKSEEETVPLYRIQDLHLTISLVERLFGVGSVLVLSSDLTAPKLKILHVSHPAAVRDRIHHLSEDAKRRRQIQVMNMRGLDYQDSLNDLDPSGLDENQEN